MAEQINADEIKLLKEIELRMLSYVIQICNRLNLHYFAVGGTLLGSVRHQGFIPWDDDIDIGMMRTDYEIFVSEANKYLPDDLFLQTRSTDPEYPNNFAKIRNSKTTYIEATLRNCKINHGVFIDIFPFDYYSDNKFVSKIHDITLTIQKQKIAQVYCFDSTSICNWKTKAATWLSDCFYKSVSDALDAMEKNMQSIKSSSLMTNYCGAWGNREIVPVEWLTDRCVLQFEGMDIYAPKEYDKYLRNLYGDYMQLPPEEKRVGHHYVFAFDLNKPYTYYLK